MVFTVWWDRDEFLKSGMSVSNSIGVSRTLGSLITLESLHTKHRTSLHKLMSKTLYIQN
jgi:hypothetical protein